MDSASADRIKLGLIAVAETINNLARSKQLEQEREAIVQIIMGNSKCANLLPYIQSIVNELNRYRERYPDPGDENE